MLLFITFRILLNPPFRTTMSILRVPVVTLMITLRRRRDLIIHSSLQVSKVINTPTGQGVMSNVRGINLARAVVTSGAISLKQGLRINTLSIFMVGGKGVLWGRECFSTG